MKQWLLALKLELCGLGSTEANPSSWYLLSVSPPLFRLRQWPMSHRPSSSLSVPPHLPQNGWVCVHVWVDGYVHVEWSGVHGDIECLAVSWPHSHAVVTRCMYVDPHVHGGGVKCGKAKTSWLVMVAGPIFGNQLTRKCHMSLSGLFNSCSKSALAGISEDSFKIWYVLTHPKDFLLEHALSTKSPAKRQIGKNQSVNCSQ